MIWKNWITSYFCVKLHGLIAMASFLSGFHISVEQNPEQKNHSPTPLQAWLFGKWVQNKKAQLSVSLFVLLCCLPYVLFADEAWKKIEQSGQLRWGADVSGGAPYVFPAPENPTQIIGFEVEIMDALCQRLGVQAKLVSVQWDQLIPALLREDFDIAFNGVEITPERVSIIDFTIPYYFFSEQISSRYGDDRFKKLEDLYGHRVGTLSTTLAQRILEQHKQITVVPYPTPVEVYRDLEAGRIDAALQDVPIATWYIPLNTTLQNTGEPLGEGIYAGALRKDSPLLKEKINNAISELILSGDLEKIYRKWNIWTPAQKKLTDQVTHSKQNTLKEKVSLARYVPLILKGAAMTVAISCLAMFLAILFGFILCISKLYGSRPLKICASTYIEIVRGTPLLIQLYLLYYGLPNIGIHLNAFVAAVIGMGMNYSAYEAEIYRAGLLAVPQGQDEAARSLGMRGRQSLLYIILPQAIRTILPPSTNDFIALFKDTSLVSIITVTELTRAYTQAANTTYRFFELGILTAALYFIMSFPLSLWSSTMEKKRHVIMH